MAQVKHGDMVKIHYTGKLSDGTVFDTSLGREPLQFEIGASRLIPAFEQAVVGMTPGESKTANIPAEEAYGPHRADMVVVVERNNLPAHIEPEVGQQLQSVQEDGQTIRLIVTEVTDSSVTLDTNHPLAGQDLTFEIQLLEIV